MADAAYGSGAFPFARNAGAAERSWPRAVVTVILAGAAGALASMVAVTLVILVASAIAAARGDVGWSEAVGLLVMDADRPGRPLPSYLFELAVVGISSMAAVGAFAAVCARRAGRPILSFLTLATRFRWGHAVAGLVLFLPVVAAEIWIESLALGGVSAPIATPGASVFDRLVYAGGALVFLWLAALAEELLFRGWLLQQTHALTRRLVVVIVLNAALFTLAHGDFSAGGLIARFAMGAGWAWVVLRLDGVEFTAGAHLANNLGIALLAQPVMLAASPEQPMEVLSVALQVGTLAALTVAVEVWVRRRDAAISAHPVAAAP